METSDQNKFVPNEEKNEGVRDLQKEYHRILKEKGDTEALQFLYDNYDKNPNYAEKYALKMAAGLNDTLQKQLFESSVNEVKARLYVEFRQQSERQKTKMSGFKGFVQQYIDGLEAEGGEFTPEELQFNEELLNDTQRYDSARAFESSVATKITERTNYRKVADAVASRLSVNQEKMILINKIVEKSGS